MCRLGPVGDHDRIDIPQLRQRSDMSVVLPGWMDIETTVDNRPLYLPPDPLAAAKMTMASGPVQALLEGQPEMVRAEVAAALAADYTHRQNKSGIELPAGFIVVAARRP